MLRYGDKQTTLPQTLKKGLMHGVLKQLGLPQEVLDAQATKRLKKEMRRTEATAAPSPSIPQLSQTSGGARPHDPRFPRKT
jgi:hypothetical protein